MPRTLRALPVACAAVACALGPSALAARAEALAHLEGELLGVTAPGVFSTPLAVVGTFTLDGLDGRDLRSAPGQIMIATPDSQLIAIGAAPAHFYRAWRFDPASGRPLRADAAPDATCPTGAEPDCWLPGDVTPGDLAAFDALCTARAGAVPPSIADCSHLVRPDNPVITGGGLPPLGTITTDSQDGSSGGSGGLTADQQALLGCGPFWGTDCANDGIDLLFAYASVLLESFGHSPPMTPCPGRPGMCFADELAAVSYNLQVLLASLQTCPSDGSPCTWNGDPTSFDPSRPFSTAPGQCSWAQPQFCSTVDSLLGLSTTVLADDPNGAPLGRWIWESGAAYTVASATGPLVGFAGGIVHLADPEPSRAVGWRVGVPIVLLPPGASDPAPLFLYAVAPEPDDGALGASALAALAGCTARRARRLGPV